jgi:hypothetical protein
MLVEDSPEKITSNLNTDDLDHALLMLCEEASYDKSEIVEETNQEAFISDNSNESSSNFSLQRFKALIVNELIYIRTKLA